jgi:hypothetical protein
MKKVKQILAEDYHNLSLNDASDLDELAEQEVQNVEKCLEFHSTGDLPCMIEMHESYLVLLRKSDGRLSPTPPVDLISRRCKCGQRCDALLSM